MLPAQGRCHVEYGRGTSCNNRASAGGAAAPRRPAARMAIAALVVVLAGCSTQQREAVHGHQGLDGPPPLYDSLGSYSYRITTTTPTAQRWFDQGLRLVYAFNHAEAQRAFREAVRLDPSCAMCFWGVALTEGGNYNDPTDADREKKALSAVQAAQALAAGVGPGERALILALAKRHSGESGATRADLDRAYADAMREVSRQFPDDLEAATFFADAAMNLRPWNLWAPDGTPNPGTEAIVQTLEGVLARAPNHPGAIHLYIHAVEASAKPGRAEAAADRLLKHMPDRETAPVAPIVALVRFGRWDDVLGLAAPPTEWIYTTGVWRYARGLAFNAKGDAAGARRELAELETLLRSVSPARSLAFFFRAKNVLQLAANVLAGEIAAKAGDGVTAELLLRAAVAEQDGHWFTEPPPWYFPVRQALGAVLLQAGRAANAERVYREDLERNPGNGWSLFGLAQALRAQGKTADAARAAERFPRLRERGARVDRVAERGDGRGPVLRDAGADASIELALSTAFGRRLPDWIRSGRAGLGQAHGGRQHRDRQRDRHREFHPHRSVARPPFAASRALRRLSTARRSASVSTPTVGSVVSVATIAMPFSRNLSCSSFSVSSSGEGARRWKASSAAFRYA